MPFLMHYTDMKVLNGLGYKLDMSELDVYTATCLVHIKAELNKLESEDMKQKTQKGSSRGR